MHEPKVFQVISFYEKFVIFNLSSLFNLFKLQPLIFSGDFKLFKNWYKLLKTTEKVTKPLFCKLKQSKSYLLPPIKFGNEF